MNPLLSAALDYAARGLRVLPLEPLGKRPLTELAPRGVHSASADAAQLKRWWLEYPEANIGIAIPPEWVVVDVDPRNGGNATAQALDLEHGSSWHETLSARTGGGGWHFVLEVPPGTKLPGKLGKGVDVKQAGGYIMAAPSVHESGRVYEWENANAPAAAPAWLLAKAKGSATTPRKARNQGAELTPEECLDLDQLVALVEPHFDEGQRNGLALALGGLLCNAGYSIASAEYVLGQLPSNEPEARIYDAERAWSADNPAGWSALTEYLPADAAAGVQELQLLGGHARIMRERAERRHAQAVAAAEKPRARLEQAPTDDGWGKLPLRIIDPSEEAKPLRYHWGPFAPGKVSAIIGYAYNAKTPFAVLFSLCSAAGQSDFLGLPITSERKALHIVFEGALNARRKALRLARGLGGTLETVRGCFDFGVMPSSSLMPADAEELAERAHAQGYGLLVLDTYGSAVAADIDRNAAAISDALKAMGDVSDRTGLIVIVLLHLNKNVKAGQSLLQAIDGHNSIAGALQAAVALTRPNAADEFLFQLTCERAPEEGFKPVQFRWRDVPEPARTMGARIAAAAREGGAEDPAKWGLVAELEGASSASREDAAHTLAVEVLAWFEAHRSNGHAAECRDVVDGLGKAQHSDTTRRVRGALAQLVEAGKLGADRPATNTRARFGLLGRKHTHAEGIVSLAGEIAGGYDVTEGAARMRAERALRT